MKFRRQVNSYELSDSESQSGIRIRVLAQFPVSVFAMLGPGTSLFPDACLPMFEEEKEVLNSTAGTGRAVTVESQSKSFILREFGYTCGAYNPLDLTDSKPVAIFVATARTPVVNPNGDQSTGPLLPNCRRVRKNAKLEWLFQEVIYV